MSGGGASNNGELDKLRERLSRLEHYFCVNEF